MDLFPVGSRPKCRYCSKELAPQFKTTPIPDEFWNNLKGDYPKRKQFRIDNPKQFTGNYGHYSDNLFCGINCGYMWAIRNAMGSIFE